MKNFRRRDKRQAYNQYAIKAEGLKLQLKTGELSQEQFDRAHELLDEQYGWLK